MKMCQLRLMLTQSSRLRVRHLYPVAHRASLLYLDVPVVLLAFTTYLGKAHKASQRYKDECSFVLGKE